MKYIDYVNHLKSNNIILFDHDYRISYNNINIYYNKYLNNNCYFIFILSCSRCRWLF